MDLTQKELEQLFSKIKDEAQNKISEDDQNYLLEDWDEALDIFLEINPNLSFTSELYSIEPILVNNIISKNGKDAFGLTTKLNDGTLAVEFSKNIYGLSDANKWSTILHEICHCAAYYTDGSLDHGVTWEKYTNSIMKKMTKIKITKEITDTDLQD